MRRRPRTPEERQVEKVRKQAYYLANKERWRAYAKRWREENREKYRATGRAWQIEHREHLNRRAREQRVKNPVKLKLQRVMRTHGISEMQARALLEIKICQSCLKRPATCIDHVHLPDGSDGPIRGCLCQPCNKAEGFLHDPEELEALAAYLRRTNAGIKM